MIVIVDTKLLAYNELHNCNPVLNLFVTLSNMIEQIEYKSFEKVTKIVFVYDIGKSDYRLGLWSLYKGKRVYNSVPSDFKSNYENGVICVANALGISSFPIAGVEADDLAGILCGKITKDIVLISGDHDWLGIVLRHDHVKFFNTKTRELMDKSNVKEFTQCDTEEQFLVKKCILGDIGDNILGIYGVGPVSYADWLNENNGISDSELKAAFLKLCATKKKPIHQDYINSGVKSCEELYDFNMKLAKIMTGVKSLTEQQKIALSNYWKIHCIPKACSLSKASEVSKEYVGDYETPFGDPWSLSEIELEIYDGI